MISALVAAAALSASAPVVIHRDLGGEVPAYEQFAAYLVAARRLVVIDGPCMSACTWLVVRPDVKVCMTWRARLAFHQANDDRSKPYPELWASEIDKRGGLPSSASGRFITLDYFDLRGLVPSCTNRQLRSARL